MFVDTLGKMSGEILGKLMGSALLLEDEVQILSGAYMDKLEFVHKIKSGSCQAGEKNNG